MKTINAEDIGRRGIVVSDKPLTDLQLLAEIARLRKSVASFGGAMLLSAYRAEAERRGLKAK